MGVRDVGRAFDGAGGVDVGDDGVGLFGSVSELEEGGGDGLVDDLDHAAADEFFVFDEGEIGLDAGGVAIHHEADGAGGGEDGDLGVAVSVALTEGEGLVPGGLGGGDEGGELGLGGRSKTKVLRLKPAVRLSRFARKIGGLIAQDDSGSDVVDGGAVHADDVEEGFAIDVEAGAGATVLIVLLGEGGGGGEVRAFGGDAGGLEVGFAAHDGGDGGGEVASGG